MSLRFQKEFNSCHHKRISYILPTKNRVGHLREALAKIRPFKKAEDELIIIDGGSKDDTKDVVLQNWDLIEKFVSEPDVPGEATNKGILLARGKYVKFLDDDEITRFDEVEKAVLTLEAHPEIDMLLCGGTMYFENKKKDKPIYIYIPRGKEFGLHPDDVLTHWVIAGPCMVIRRTLFARAGLFTSTLVSDFEFVARAIASGARVQFCRLNLFENRANSESVTYLRKHEAYAEKKAIIKKYCSRAGYYLYLLKKSKITRRLKIAKYYDPLSRALWNYHRGGMRRVILGLFSRREPAKEPIWDGGLS